MQYILKARLHAIDTTGWSIPEQVDWHIVRAEMNGFDFNHRILKPWVRDPAFYQSIWLYRSDVPNHEGPTHHAVTELWTYEFPLSPSEEQRLIQDLNVIPPLMRQAQQNLTGNARELWITGIRNIKSQLANLGEVRRRAGDVASKQILDVIQEGEIATEELIAWLEEQASFKDGPSGIGLPPEIWGLQLPDRFDTLPFCFG